MPANKTNIKTAPLPVDPYPLDKLLNGIAVIYLVSIVAVLPLAMGAEKLSQITKYKATFFTVCTVITAIAVLSAALLNFCTRETAVSLDKKVMLGGTFVADAAILTYLFFMLISCIFAENGQTAIYGIGTRNNGLLFQLLYIIAYFVISRSLKPKWIYSMVFVWGGAALATVCILHYYGIDLYDVVHYTTVNGDGETVARMLDESYAGPFYNSTTYRFLGPVGNVNLGSYVLCIALIVAAGLFVTGVKPKFDKLNATTIVCFFIILFAELNMNTDAGLVSMAAAALLMPVMLCTDIARVGRMLLVYAVSAGAVLLDHTIDGVLLGESFGSTGKLLLLIMAFFAVLSAAAHICSAKFGGKLKIRARAIRAVCGALALVAVVGGIALSLYATVPDEPAAGALSGATKVITAHDLRDKSDTIVHELGQILRGNLNDRFGHNRLFTWKRTLNLVKLRPIIGIGPDNFREYFARFYYDEALVMFPASNGGLDKAHNEFLDILLSNGILGLASYLTFLAALVYYGVRKAKEKPIAAVFAVAVVGYAAHAFFGYQLPIQSPIMWVMLGCAACYAGKEPVAESNKKLKDNRERQPHSA